MQILRREDKTVLLDGNEVYTLEKAVDSLAMCVVDDYLALKRSIPNSTGKEVSKDELEFEMQILTVLSSALRAVNGIRRPL